jgi:hypothetical protein
VARRFVLSFLYEDDVGADEDGDERFRTRTPGNCQCLRRMRVWICKLSSLIFEDYNTLKLIPAVQFS